MVSARGLSPGGRRLRGVAGRIREEDIAEVREKAKIDEVVSDYVTLRPAGGGSLKGLCPFHDEKSPSFNVNPARGFCHCFGCGEGGDVIAFLMKIDGLGFTEAVERLADKYGVTLRREEGDVRDGPAARARSAARLIEAHRVAQEFYADALGHARRASSARQFLGERGFDQAAAEQFGVGFAPRDGEALLAHLRQKGFTDEELVAAGLVAVGRSAYDRFRGRLLWPIRDVQRRHHRLRRAADLRRRPDRGEVPQHPRDPDLQEEPGALRHRPGPPRHRPLVAGGGRRGLHRRDGLPPRRRADRGRDLRHGVRRRPRPGAAPLPQRPRGVPRRGDLHLRRRRRRAEGRAAGLRRRPELRRPRPTSPSSRPASTRATCGIQQGDAAVRELVARRVPLYRFVLGNVVSKYDLDRADGRVDAVREAARLVSRIRDKSKVEAFARELAGMVGVDVEQARAEVRRAAGAAGPRPRRGRAAPARRRSAAAGAAAHRRCPTCATRGSPSSARRSSWSSRTRRPSAGPPPTSAPTTSPTRPTARSGSWSSSAAGSAAGRRRLGRAGCATPRPTRPSRRRCRALGGRAGAEPQGARRRVRRQHVYRLQELTALRRIAEVKSRLQRTNPVEHTAEYNRMFGELAALEQHRRQLRDLALGAQ